MTVPPRVIPCLLLSGGQFVKTRRFADPRYVGDPVNVLSIFSSFEVDEIILLDIDSAHRRSPTPFDELRRYAEECFIPLAYGGGLESVGMLTEVFRAGYEKAIINTAIAERPESVREAVDQFGSQAIVASIDVRTVGGQRTAYVRGGTVDTCIRPVELAIRAVTLGVGEIFLTSIDREGTLQGFDIDLIKEVTGAVDVPVIAHGGAARRSDLRTPIIEAGASAVAAGSLFLFQRSRDSVLINYPSRTQIVGLLSVESGEGFSIARHDVEEI